MQTRQFSHAAEPIRRKPQCLLTGISAEQTTGPRDSTAPTFSGLRCNSKRIMTTIFTRWQHYVVLRLITMHLLPLNFLSHTVKEKQCKTMILRCSQQITQKALQYVISLLLDAPNIMHNNHFLHLTHAISAVTSFQSLIF